MISGVCVQDKYDEKARRFGAAGYIRKTELWPSLRDKVQALHHSKDRPTPLGSARDIPTGGTVLVADDESEWLMLTSRWLADAGYRVVTTGKDSAVAASAMKHWGKVEKGGITIGILGGTPNRRVRVDSGDGLRDDPKNN